MSQVSRTTAKTYFQTGDTPTEGEFVNTLDSVAWYDEAVTTTSTAGGDISGTFSNLQIAAGAVTATELGSGAVTTAKIAAGAVTTTELGSGAVTTAKIAAGAVTTTELGSGAVTTAKIAAGAVTATELGSGAVTTAKIAAGAVTATEIATGAVGATQLAATAVTAGEYTNPTITVDADGRITAAASGSVTPLYEYSAGNGARVTASATGVTFERTTSSAWAFSIPAGVHITSFSIYTDAGTQPTTLDVSFNYVSNSTFNLGASTARPPRGIHVFTWGTATPPYIPATTANANAGVNAKVNLQAVASGNITIRFTSFSTTVGSVYPNTIFGGF